ncbi:MAG: hypothetical protein U0166_25435 [Acidobacteriota bacterium]
MARQVGWGGFFRTSLRASFLVVAFTIAARLTVPQAVATRDLVTIAAGLLAAAIVFAVAAVRARGDATWLASLFAPGASRLREAIWVLSFFAFTDPGEVSWHAVDQAEGRRRLRVSRLSATVLWYVVLVFPAALLCDWLVERGLRITLAAALYLPPWALLRAMEDVARRRSRAAS